MNNSNNFITSKQLMAFIVSAQIGFGILSLPSDLANYLGHDGWISLLLSGIAIIFISILLMQLLKKFRDKSILEISPIVFGKVLGFCFNIFIILHLAFLSTVGIRVFTEVLVLIALRKTPQLFITICILLPTIYMASKGLKVICRYTSFLYVSFAGLIILLLLARQNFQYTFLFPINEIGFQRLINYMYIPFFSYIGYGLVAIIYNNIRDKENATKYIIYSEIFTIIFFVAVTIMLTLQFGENKLKILIFPVFSAIQSLHLPIIERLDIFFILFWFPTMASSFNCFYFSSYYSIMETFKFKNKRLVLCLFSLVLLIVSRIPKEFSDLYYYIQLTWKSDLIFLGIMIFALILSAFRRKGATAQ